MLNDNFGADLKNILKKIGAILLVLTIVFLVSVTIPYVTARYTPVSNQWQLSYWVQTGMWAAFLVLASFMSEDDKDTWFDDGWDREDD